MSVIDWQLHSGVCPPLGVGEAHLWSLSPLRSHAEFLSPLEAQRHTRMASEEAAMHYAAAQGGLRRVLGLYLDRDPREIPILRQARGKPYVAGGPEFNLTHTGNHILLALAREPVGLDVEIASRVVSAQALSRKFFSPEEAEDIESHPEHQRGARFLRYWVCKESTVKLSGDGIYYGLRQALVTLGPEAGASGLYYGRKVSYQELLPAEGVVAALASWQPLQAKCFLRL